MFDNLFYYEIEFCIEESFLFAYGVTYSSLKKIIISKNQCCLFRPNASMFCASKNDVHIHITYYNFGVAQMCFQFLFLINSLTCL